MNEINVPDSVRVEAVRLFEVLKSQHPEASGEYLLSQALLHWASQRELTDLACESIRVQKEKIDTLKARLVVEQSGTEEVRGERDALRRRLDELNDEIAKMLVTRLPDGL